ncbi:competence protein TfoX [Clostridium sp. chh4-2]|uniref:TfoX/Sxy family protein n=1 Tax=Clostridium sp. chh4-2 TaxID=2067550 RepID=UPI000CCF0FA6|nr:TfoX/Sxy family protein [Clostridium sp. chh4-2]PNV63578.1 competence protein TfoX [Clostridium sp. chh4-2]
MGELAKLPNLGPVIEEQLIQVGITTYEQLKETGSKQAWLKIKAIDSSACIHRLLAMEGAIRGIKKTQLPEETKAELREFYHAAKQ